MKSAILVVGTILALASFGAFQPQTASAQTQRFSDGASLAAAEAKHRTQIQARATVESLFARLCPGRCELLGFDVVVGEATPIDLLSPGFEPASPDAHQVATERIQVSILLDSALPADFRRNIPRLIRFRLQSIAPTVEVRTETLQFPEPQLEPMPPAYQEPMPWLEPPRPLPETEPVPERVEPEVAAEPDWSRFLPWIVLLLMSVILLMALWMVLRHGTRRLDEPEKGLATEPDPATTTPPPSAMEIESLREELFASRPVRSELARRWLEENPGGLANLVRVVGPDLVLDLRGDPDLAPKLEQLATEVARGTRALEPEELRGILMEARARLTSARITTLDDALSREWSFLEGMTAAEIQKALAPLTLTERSWILPRVRPALRGAYLQRLSDRERREILRAAATSDDPRREDLLELAHRVRQTAAENSIGVGLDGRVDTLLEMIESLEPTEQISFLRDLLGGRRDLALGLLRRLIIEPAWLHAPEEAIVETIHRLPIESFVQVLRGAPSSIGVHLMSLVPRSKQAAIKTELELDMPIARGEHMLARRIFNNTLVQAILDAGEDPAAINLRALKSTETEALEAAS